MAKKEKEDTWFIEDPFKGIVKKTAKSAAKMEAASILLKAIKMASELIDE